MLRITWAEDNGRSRYYTSMHAHTSKSRSVQEVKQKIHSYNADAPIVRWHRLCNRVRTLLDIQFCELVLFFVEQKPEKKHFRRRKYSC